MVLDTSAFVAILQNGPERGKFNEAIESAETRSLPAVSFVDLESRFGANGVRDLDTAGLRLYLEKTRPLDQKRH